MIDHWVRYCDFCNEYGPTETTVTSVQSLVKRGEKPGEKGIGKGLNNTYLYVLGANMRPQPMGVPGELYIGGDGVARGYLNRVQLTADVFKPNPFIDGQRIYKTGDLVKWRGDGNIDFIGRIDHQVKIRGYRIELAEIENRLANQPRVKKAILLVREDRPGSLRNGARKQWKSFYLALI